jgi:hypothetical protein
MGMAAAGLAFSAVGALSQIRQAQAVQAQMKAQAQEAEIQAKNREIEAKQRAADHLKRLNETLASTTARAAANGIQALEGSALALQNYAIAEGGREYQLAMDNAAIAKSMGAYQSKVYKSAGKTAMQQGILGAGLTLGQGYMAYSQLAPASSSYAPASNAGPVQLVSFGKT